MVRLMLLTMGSCGLGGSTVGICMRSRVSGVRVLSGRGGGTGGVGDGITCLRAEPGILVKDLCNGGSDTVA